MPLRLRLLSDAHGGNDRSPAAEPREPDTSDVLIAARNAVTLGASLVATWSVALLVRFFLPRHLGPERFGALSFAEGFTAAAFVVLGLGAETYIQKEIPVRPRHASEFFGGFVVLRLAISVLVFATMAILLAVAGRSPAVQRTVFIFGVAQILVVQNGNMAALLHAARIVGGLALVNVGTKLLWGACVGLALVADLDLPGLALAFLVAELVRAVLLFLSVRRHLGIRMVWDPPAVRAVVVASLPFYLNQMATTVYAKVDVTLLAALSNDSEVGWYGSAFNVAALSFLVSPLVGWVLLPLLSRAAARSQEEMFAILRWTIRALVVLLLPLTLAIGLAAEVWVKALFGEAFTPAVWSLRILAPAVVITYLAMAATMCLTLLDRAWTVTVVALGRLAANLALSAALVPRAARWLGPGGAGAGAATALVVAEVGMTAALFVSIGARAFDRENASIIARAVSCALLVIAADASLRPLGAARFAIDAAAYASLLAALRVIRVSDVRKALDLVRALRRAEAGAYPKVQAPRSGERSGLQ
jgi:O-antigen/teichoic acid export membrane protein